MFPLLFNLTDNLASAHPRVFLYNTLSREKELFAPLEEGKARIYTCGPTVYNFAHIGNLRAYVFADTLRRVLEDAGLEVKQVMNITDVGHLTSDADEGEDKMVKALRREGKDMSLAAMREVADTYTEAFKKDLALLGVKTPTVMPRATEHIPAMVALIASLIEKEYAYRTSDGIYFDTARFKGYGKLGGIDTAALKAGARVDTNPQKRSQQDFVLWKFSNDLGWETPFGKGFPGWHIECSAMSMQYLGKSFDIHTGGIDHIGTHHNNEIAQSEAATGRPFVRYWLHSEFLTLGGEKIAKSLGNELYLSSLIEHGFPALSYRYLLLTTHYRQPLTFTFPALEAAGRAYERLVRIFTEELLGATEGRVQEAYLRRFREALRDDLGTPQGLALLWELVKDKTVDPKDKRATMLAMDAVLGLGLRELRKNAALGKVRLTVVPLKELPEEVRLLVIAREEMRDKGDFAKADELRAAIEAHHYTLKDTPEGPEVRAFAR